MKKSNRKLCLIIALIGAISISVIAAVGITLSKKADPPPTSTEIKVNGSTSTKSSSEDALDRFFAKTVADYNAATDKIFICQCIIAASIGLCIIILIGTIGLCIVYTDRYHSIKTPKF